MDFGKDFFSWIRFAVMVLQVLIQIFGDEETKLSSRKLVGALKNGGAESLKAALAETAEEV